MPKCHLLAVAPVLEAFFTAAAEMLSGDKGKLGITLHTSWPFLVKNSLLFLQAKWAFKGAVAVHWASALGTDFLVLLLAAATVEPLGQHPCTAAYFISL